MADMLGVNLVLRAQRRNPLSLVMELRFHREVIKLIGALKDTQKFVLESILKGSAENKIVG